MVFQWICVNKVYSSCYSFPRFETYGFLEIKIFLNNFYYEIWQKIKEFWLKSFRNNDDKFDYLE